MSIYITDECINCGACEPECPNNAIYPGGAIWTMAEGTTLTDSFTLNNGVTVGAFDEQKPLSEDIYFVVPEKCVECTGFHDEPQCASVCPVDCCLVDENNVESKEELEAKREVLNAE